MIWSAAAGSNLSDNFRSQAELREQQIGIRKDGASASFDWLNLHPGGKQGGENTRKDPFDRRRRDAYCEMRRRMGRLAHSGETGYPGLVMDSVNSTECESGNEYRHDVEIPRPLPKLLCLQPIQRAPGCLRLSIHNRDRSGLRCAGDSSRTRTC